jgi:hypothetical protein
MVKVGGGSGLIERDGDSFWVVDIAANNTSTILGTTVVKV